MLRLDLLTTMLNICWPLYYPTLKKLLCASVSSARLHKESGFARNTDALREQGMSVRVSLEQLWVVSVPLQQAQLPKSRALLLM